MKKMIKGIKTTLALGVLTFSAAGMFLIDTQDISVNADSPDFYIAGGAVRYVAPVTDMDEVDENGVRFAVAVGQSLFEELANDERTAFDENVTIGALALPADLVDSSEMVLTKDTAIKEGDFEIASVEFSFSDFESTIELDGYQVAWLSLYNIPVSSYNRNFLVSAWYQLGEEEPIYTETASGCMAQLAKGAAEIETDLEKKENLETYIKNYAVKFHVDGNEVEVIGVKYGEKIADTDIPFDETTIDGWYLDPDCTQKFDMTQPITGTTKLYAKTIVDLTGGVFESLDSTYVVGKDDNGALTLTQTLKNSVAREGIAKFNVEAGKDYYVSVDMKLTGPMKVASQGWYDSGNDRIGMALINENGENYRIQMRPTMLVLCKYEKATVLYNDENKMATFLLGSTNGTTNDVYHQAIPYLQLKNTSNLNHIYVISFAMSKIGTTLTFFVNGEVAYTQEVEADFNGVPALFAYSFVSPATQVITYSNIVVKTDVAAMFSEKTSDFSFDANGNLTHELSQNANGVAKINVDGSKDYTVRLTASFFDKDGNAATAGPGEEDDTAKMNGKNNHIGVTFFGDNDVSYNYGYSMMYYSVIRMVNESGKNLYNDTDYTLSSGGNARKSFYSVRDKIGKKDDTQVEIKMVKSGNTITVYFNDYKLETLTVAENVALVPSILSYDLSEATNAVTVKYSNILVVQ